MAPLTMLMWDIVAPVFRNRGSSGKVNAQLTAQVTGTHGDHFLLRQSFSSFIGIVLEISLPGISVSFHT